MKKAHVYLVLAFFNACIIMLPGCKKNPELPTLTTTAVTEITPTTALTGGNVTSSGGSEVTAKGVCWGIVHNPVITHSKTIDGPGTGEFISNITGLSPNTTYYLRAYATNSEGTAYGNEITFTANPTALATLTTQTVTAITLASAVSGGSITDNGGEDPTDVGICWGTVSNPTTSDSKIALYGSPGFSGFMIGLQPSTKYYVRAYATNSAGIAYGNEVSFTTSAISEIIFNPELTYGSVTDIDGNIYKTIQIGTQIWMAENLKTTKFNDGSSIPDVTDNTEWENSTTGALCWYNNDAATYKTIFGALYNWYAVTDNRNICPTGWHVPESDEWNTLATFIGSADINKKIKETGTTHWISLYAGGTNESGFTALPAGIRDPAVIYQFLNLSYQGSWWSYTSTSISELNADYYTTESLDDEGYSALLPGFQALRSSGISVRCVQD